ncbi:C2 domain-containing protein 5 isoform X20 [Mobula hypostoma]|uniref:C2 domain-containing protein 5 isoform X20 n=1 Tax=Mobula hypostoma TaxID=723540 RepID=UPI002FC2E8EE
MWFSIQRPERVSFGAPAKPWMPFDSQQPNSHCYGLETNSELLCVCSYTHLHWVPFSEDPNPVTHSSGPSTPLKNQTYSFSPSKSYSRQSSSSDTDLSLTPKTGMGSGSGGKDGGPLKTLYRQQTQSAFEHREFPFFTLTTFPPGFLVHVGGVVSARSVKLLDRIHNPDEPETRDAWWAEIRQEIKSHGKALGCHAVVGYSESTSICEEVCILSASGTAAVLNPKMLQDCSMEGCSEHRLDDASSVGCSFCHIPYDELNMPFPAHLTYCYVCRKQKVPDVLFTTIEPPLEAPITGKGCLIQARLCRQKKKTQGEANATAISNLLPFMEYELHTQLMNKLKLRGMNALFGLRVQIAVGENMLMGLASATGLYVTALPSPGGIQVAGKTPSDLSYDQHISNIQKKINDMIIKNREIHEINPPEILEELLGSPIPETRQRSRLFRSHSESSDDVSELDLSHGKKDAFVLEIDDADAVEDIQSLLTDAPTPPGFYSCNTEVMPGINNWTSDLQMFTSVRVFRLNNVTSLTSQGLNKAFSDLCENLLKTLYFKLRSMVPCCLCHVNFNVALPEDELIQVAVTAVAITYDKDQAQCTKVCNDKTLLRASAENEEQLQFTLELCMESQSSQSVVPSSPSKAAVASLDKASPLAEAHTRHRSPISCTTSTVTVVEMTPLSYIPGAKITKYLGIINMFFIRETTSLREEGGVSGFLHAFIAEVFAMVRAHVAALGGNAVVSYIVKQCVFMENPNKNQAQCLINVSGDAVNFVKDSDAEYASSQTQGCGLQTGNGSGDVT